MNWNKINRLVFEVFLLQFYKESLQSNQKKNSFVFRDVMEWWNEWTNDRLIVLKLQILVQEHSVEEDRKNMKYDILLTLLSSQIPTIQCPHSSILNSYR